jgi:Peptidase family C25
MTMLNELSSPLLWFNGLDGRRGSYLTPPMPPRHLADLACGATVDPARVRDLQKWVARGEGKARRGLKEGLDPGKLEEAGWGVIFPASADSAVLREALAPLLDLRRAQAGKRQERFYREFAGEDGYREGESKVAFLTRHGAGPGPADPEKVPYYLLLIGDPEAIPFSFQYQLDVQYAVGRLCFDEIEEYRRYAESVAAAETGGTRRLKRACFFAPANPGDPVSGSTSAHLAKPLADGLRGQAGWDVETVLGEKATRSRLGGLLDEAPAFLFAACHGLGFAAGDPEQRDRQGALVCQDWPGPGPGGIDREHYFAAEDVDEQARVHGLIAFCFACFGAGTPRWDDFTRKGQGERRALAPGAFLGRLPQRLLGHPRGGALAVVGHVERAWGFSLVWPDAGPQTATFESTLRRLLAGQPVGWAMEFFNQRYAELTSDLAAEVEALGFGKKLDERVLTDLWTASHDARNYTILGDPAVRVAAPATLKEVNHEN